MGEIQKSKIKEERKITVFPFRCEVKIISKIFHTLVNHTALSCDLAGVNFEVNLKHERLSI